MESKIEYSLNNVIPKIVIAALILFGTNNVVFALAALALCVLFFLKSEENKAIEMLFFLMPLAPIFKLSSTSSSLFTYLELGFLLLIYVRTRFVAKKEFGYVVAFSLYILFFQIIYGELNITSTIKMIVNIAILLRISKLSVEDGSDIFLSYVAGVLCSSLYRFLDSGFFRISAYTSQKVLGFGGGVFVTRFSGLYTDPNYYAISVIISLCLIVFLYTEKRLSLIATVVLSIPLCIFAGMTSSKSALVMLAIPIIEMIYVCFKEKNYIVLSLFFIALAAIIVGVIGGRIDIFNATFDRLNLDTRNIDALTTGRTVLWRDYFNYFNEHLFKTIFGSSIAVTALKTSISFTEPHNTYIDLILQLGVVGTLGFISCVRLAYKNIQVNIRRGLQNYTLVIVLIVMYCFLSQLQGYDLPFQLGLCLILLNSWYE